MKIGLYGGSFNPVHHGHLILARDALEQLSLDKVIFLLAKVSPFKLSLPSYVPDRFRARLLRVALRGEPGLEWDDCELGRDGPSYTIDTVCQMRRRYPSAEFFYFIGGDHLPTLSSWKEYKTLCRQIRFVVLSRGDVVSEAAFPTLKRRLDISSSEIRARLSQGSSIRYLLPEPVHKILLSSRWYRPCFH
ncbi:MAG: nicotinate (nicotinamide) nucleotide adenylyltransferase [Candidatus Xiphinematobacter sp.]|nr:MAG: nicotinate (nicotinamide) nucleotide adenylyltransferase [Candidatus Xiphinematobacter sp.]QQY08331.1 MAG: nicotinate (nicotinamide) nucleotide adenylyltransferase [Candidatus Xiphinematobacter sp.]QQY09070.1 MAG: nicotinate (nicotinamide) nucleotide adenylyltransferase [Candidatus Xiphinematobacter sp.]QQY09815.1 MAG: nicotinate (nicotinamide) nucleotide adenylyltransferase [Candidatus Xiphinematobacter sp.]QQY10554.1 MAG: nicotinate (nicotinamide) nucleotide adenylyltransferase [Candi